MSDNSPNTGSSENVDRQTEANGQSSVTLSISHLIGLCSIGLLVAFFLPWLNLLIVRGSGFELAKQGGMALTLWAIPALSLVTFLAGMAKDGQKGMAQFTGCLPFFFLIAAVYENGADILKTFDYGAYASLAFGLALVVLPSRLK